MVLLTLLMPHVKLPIVLFEYVHEMLLNLNILAEETKSKARITERRKKTLRILNIDVNFQSVNLWLTVFILTEHFRYLF